MFFPHSLSDSDASVLHPAEEDQDTAGCFPEIAQEDENDYILFCRINLKSLFVKLVANSLKERKP